MNPASFRIYGKIYDRVPVTYLTTLSTCISISNYIYLLYSHLFLVQLYIPTLYSLLYLVQLYLPTLFTFISSSTISTYSIHYSLLFLFPTTSNNSLYFYLYLQLLYLVQLYYSILLTYSLFNLISISNN